MDVETRLDRITDTLFGLQSQINAIGGGMTPPERQAFDELKARLEHAEMQSRALAGELARVEKRLAALPDENAVTRKTNNAVRVTVDAVGDVLAVTADKLREETAETVRDASVNMRKMADRAQAASEATTVSATAFVRRCLHSFAS